MAWLTLPLLAVAAGILSFSSPCALPLIPGYLSYVSGLPVSELGRRETRSTTLRAALMFVAGFTLVFTALGVSFTLVGTLLLGALPTILRVAGVAMIVLGLAMIGLLRIPGFLQRELRFDMGSISRGPRAAFGLGMAFAFGWTPCIGPVLATILSLAAASNSVAWGGVLLVLYSLGLGLPFIALALGFQRAKGTLAWLRRNGRRVEVLGGLLMIAVGVAFVTGVWKTLFIPLQARFAQLGWPPI
jgi:cytochrome c-type biogenesis protein